MLPEQRGQPITCMVCGHVIQPEEISEVADPGHEASRAQQGNNRTEAVSQAPGGPPPHDPHAWLETFPPETKPTFSEDAPEVYELAEDPEPSVPPFPIPEVIIEVEPDDDEEVDSDFDFSEEPSDRPFWKDVLVSFTFVFETENLISLVVIIAIHIWSVFLSYAGFLGSIGQFFLGCYLATFYLGVIRETAAGEEQLPTIWIHNIWDDLFLPWLQFVASLLLVLVPALLLIIGCVSQGVDVPWSVVAGLAAAGLFFWPIVILGVAIGGGFQGLWPHTIVQTVLAAPLAFLAIWLVLLVSGGLYAFSSQSVWLAEVLDKLLANRPGSIFWLLLVISAAISAYAAVVAMRTIGLFYRHFKKQLPWRAE